MSSRQEQKAQRKAAREEAARQEAARQRRARLVQFGVGGLLVVAILAGIVVLAVAGGNGAEGGEGGPIDEDGEALADVQLPPQRFQELEAAVEASGCEFEEAESQGNEHVTASVPVDSYNTNPPTSGPHNPIPAEDGVYPPDSPPSHEAWIHSLEHGRIVFQYRPGTPEEQIDRLRALVQEPVQGAPGGYHTLVMANTTNMPYAFAALNWTRLLGCRELSPAAIDAMRLFREEFTDDAPERVP